MALFTPATNFTDRNTVFKPKMTFYSQSLSKMITTVVQVFP